MLSYVETNTHSHICTRKFTHTSRHIDEDTKKYRVVGINMKNWIIQSKINVKTLEHKKRKKILKNRLKKQTKKQKTNKHTNKQTHTQKTHTFKQPHTQV